MYIFLFFLLNSVSVFGQNDAASKANNKIKGIYVYQFAKNVDWPPKDKKGDFTIAVLGNQMFYEQLKSAYTGKNIGSQKISVIFYKNISEVKTPHLLYVSPYNKKTATALAKKLKNDKTLIIGEDKGLLNNGVIINFVAKNNKLAFEISQLNAKKKELIISQTLAKLAIVVVS